MNGRKMLGIINATGSFPSLKVTGHRSLAALPFGGRYRLIDFMLSNMVNSNIHSVAVLQAIKPFTNGSRWFRQTVGFR